MERCDGGVLEEDRFNAFLNLLQAYSVLTTRIGAELHASTGLSLPEHEVLMRLSQASKQGLRMLDLSSFLLISKSGVTRVIDRLERRGLVTRKMAKEDRRVVRVEPTAAGRKALNAASPVLASAIEDYFSSHLSDNDVDRLRAGLRKLLEANGVWNETVCDPSLGAEEVPAG
ncbi:MAG: MarR family winged helix-turn-helix transcriptional regulator [Actinomycetota bacterium]